MYLLDTTHCLRLFLGVLEEYTYVFEFSTVDWVEKPFYCYHKS
jgi:hypothetical protein